MNTFTRHGIIAVSIVALSIAGYAFLYQDTRAQEQSFVVDTNDVGAYDPFLETLLSIRTLTLNDSLFANPAFQSLKDFTIVLSQPGTEGRVNPFAPIAGTAAARLPIDSIADDETLLGE